MSGGSQGQPGQGRLVACAFFFRLASTSQGGKKCLVAASFFVPLALAPLGRERPATPASTPPVGSRIEKPAAGAAQGRGPCSQPSGTVATIHLLLPHQSSSLQLDYHQKSGNWSCQLFPSFVPFPPWRLSSQRQRCCSFYWPPLKFMPVQSSSFYSPYVPPERNAPVSPSPTSPQLHGVA